MMNTLAYILISVCWGLLIAFVWAAFDGLILTKKVIYKRNKSLRMCIRAFFCIYPALIASLFGKNWAFIALLWALSGFVFALSFDPLLNMVRDLSIWYRGSQANTDLLFKRNAVTQAALYMLGVIICIILLFTLKF